MAKSFAVLCQQAGIESPAFSKMRSLEVADRSPRQPSAKKEYPPERQVESKPRKSEPSSRSQSEDLVREFIKANPLPTSGQWDEATLKAYFEEYRATLKMLRGAHEKKEE